MSAYGGIIFWVYMHCFHKSGLLFLVDYFLMTGVQGACHQCYQCYQRCYQVWWRHLGWGLCFRAQSNFCHYTEVITCLTDITTNWKIFCGFNNDMIICWIGVIKSLLLIKLTYYTLTRDVQKLYHSWVQCFLRLTLLVYTGEQFNHWLICKILSKH